MEKIEALVDVLAKFGDELGNMKMLISDVESEVKKHTNNLKKEIVDFKKNLYNGKLNKELLTAAEREIYERLNELRKELGSLEDMKNINEERLSSNECKSFKTSTSNISVKSFASCDESNCTSEEKWSRPSKLPHSGPVERVIVLPYKRSNEENKSSSSSSLSNEWWKNEKITEEFESVDWTKEYADREEMKSSIVIKEGWKRQNSSFEQLEEIFQTWTGKFVKWVVVKRGKVKNGKATFTVRFDKLEDRNKVYDMRKQIAEEGNLLIGEALTYVERKERWKMLSIAERLKAEGRSVEFENKKLCIDGQWWKYYWTDGWRKL